MKMQEVIKRIGTLEEKIASYPKGNISFKTIKGKKQPYLQWTEDGIRHSEYLKQDNREEIINSIAERKILEKQLKELRSSLPQTEKAVQGKSCGIIGGYYERDNHSRRRGEYAPCIYQSGTDNRAHQSERQDGSQCSLRYRQGSPHYEDR